MPGRIPVEPEDTLREEYFKLLPGIARVSEQLRTEIQYHTLSIAQRLGKHEQLIVKARIKDCTSAIDKLRIAEEGGTFDSDNPGKYSLTSLHDLAGVRVLAFPRSLLQEIDALLRRKFPAPNWIARPVLNKETGETLAYKYYGLCPEASTSIFGEYQIASMLTGLFWEVEHAALYKMSPELKRMKGDLDMNDRASDVYRALTAFENEFEQFISRNRSSLHNP